VNGAVDEAVRKASVGRIVEKYIETKINLKNNGFGEDKRLLIMMKLSGIWGFVYSLPTTIGNKACNHLPDPCI
jgi:hypothetical protein